MNIIECARFFYVFVNLECDDEDFHDHLYTCSSLLPVAQLVMHWPVDLEVPGSILAGDENPYNSKLSSIAHSLS